jgi:hypothetical protein
MDSSAAAQAPGIAAADVAPATAMNIDAAAPFSNDHSNNAANLTTGALGAATMDFVK